MSGFLGVARGGLGALIGHSTPFRRSLQPASWRTIPFFSLGSHIVRGRRTVTHEYAQRDAVWVEDLGLATRRVTFTGFLVGDDLDAQIRTMTEAVEREGEGELVHPILGTMSAALVSWDGSEQWDAGRVFAMSFEFVEFPASTENGPRYPGAESDTKADVDGAADSASDSAATAAEDAALTDDTGSFAPTLATLQTGVGKVTSAISSVQTAVAPYLATALIGKAILSRVTGGSSSLAFWNQKGGSIPTPAAPITRTTPRPAGVTLKAPDAAP